MELVPGKSFNIQASSCIDALRNFETSTISMSRKLLRCRVAGCEVPKPSQSPSVAAGAMCSRIQEMEAMTDTHLEFVLCEFSKLVECVAAEDFITANRHIERSKTKYKPRSTQLKSA